MCYRGYILPMYLSRYLLNSFQPSLTTSALFRHIRFPWLDGGTWMLCPCPLNATSQPSLQSNERSGDLNPKCQTCRGIVFRASGRRRFLHLWCKTALAATPNLARCVDSTRHIRKGRGRAPQVSPLTGPAQRTWERERRGKLAYGSALATIRSSKRCQEVQSIFLNVSV